MNVNELVEAVKQMDDYQIGLLCVLVQIHHYWHRSRPFVLVLAVVCAILTGGELLWCVPAVVLIVLSWTPEPWYCLARFFYSHKNYS